MSEIMVPKVKYILNERARGRKKLIKLNNDKRTECFCSPIVHFAHHHVMNVFDKLYNNMKKGHRFPYKFIIALKDACNLYYT